MKHLYFVRHGLSIMNKQGFYSGRTETPLAAEGLEQVHQAGKDLQDKQVDCIVTSPMKRAVDTAHIIAEEIGFPIDKIIVSDLFMERDFGPLEGTVYSADTHLDTHKGVEHSNELVARSQKGLDYLKTLPADTILVVSHGAVGRALQHLLQKTPSFRETDRFENAKVVKLL